jgi:hypothetical protein
LSRGCLYGSKPKLADRRRLFRILQFISFTAGGKTFKLEIAGVADVTVEGITGAGGQVVWLDNVGHPFSTRLAAARGTHSHYTDHSLSFENSGRNGHFSAINWTNG